MHINNIQITVEEKSPKSKYALDGDTCPFKKSVDSFFYLC
jgi:hypothetical protein